MTDEATVERVGRAVRRRKFERTRRLAHYDATVPLTENELDDARAAIAAIPGWHLSHTTTPPTGYVEITGTGKGNRKFVSLRQPAPPEEGQ